MLDFGFYNMDCMEGMKEFPDNYFDLAIVDPPYGDANGDEGGYNRFGAWFDKYKTPIEGGCNEQAEHGRVSTRKKSYRGMLPPGKPILMSFFASHEIKLYGGELL